MMSSAQVGAAIDASPISRFQQRVIGLSCLSTFLDGYDSQALALAVPRIAEEWHLPPTAFAYALSGSLLGIALGAVLLAPLADRWGRRPTLIASMVIVGLTTAGVALSTDIRLLTIWRVVTGLGLGAAVPIATAMISEYAPARRRTALVAVMVACLALGSVTAGLIAPILNSLWGWRGIFGVGAVLPLLMAGALAALLPESLRFLIAHGGRSDQIGLQMGQMIPNWKPPSGLASVKRTELRASVTSLFSAAYRLRTFLVWTIFWLNLFVVYSVASWLPTLLHAAGWDHAASQRASGLIPFGGIAGGLLIAWIADRGHAISGLFWAYLLTAVLLASFMIAPDDSTLWVGMLLFVGVGAVGGQMAAVSIASASFYPPELRATGVGWFNGFSRTGAMVGPLVLAAFMNAGVSTKHVLGLLSLPLLLCAGAVLLLPRALKEGGPV